MPRLSSRVCVGLARLVCPHLVLALASGCVDWFTSDLATDVEPVSFNVVGAAPVEATVSGSPIYSRIPVFDSIPGKAGSHSPAVAALSNGDLLAAWFSYGGPHELTGSAIYMSRLSAGQGVWQEPWMHADRPQGDGNPVLYAEGERVLFFQAVVPGLWSTSHIESQVSEDGGRTWSEASVLPGPLGANVRFPPIRAASGGLVLPAYDDLLQRGLFYESSDGLGWTLSAVVSANPPAVQPSIAALADGRLLGVMRNTAGGWLWVTESRDDGISWSPLQDSGFDNPGSPAELIRLASGNLLLIFNDSPSERIALTAALSADEGVTWPYRRGLTDEEENCSYPAVCQSGDGAVHVLFSAARERIDHITFNEAWVVQGGHPDVSKGRVLK